MLSRWLQVDSKDIMIRDILPDTPIEEYIVSGRKIYVKREDLSCPPSNAKARGVAVHVAKVKAKGYDKVGVLNTRVSRAGWVVAWIASKLGVKAYVYYPDYKDKAKVPWRWLNKAKELGAELVPVKPGRDWWLYAQAIRHAKQHGIYLLPDKLKLRESVEEVSKQVETVPRDILRGTIIISVGSGTMLAGIIKGLTMQGVVPKRLVGVMVSSEATVTSRQRYIRELTKPELVSYTIYKDILRNTIIVPGKWSYFEPVVVNAPFSIDRYYDSKAWAWLLENIDMLPEPILFWNVGGDV